MLLFMQQVLVDWICVIQICYMLHFVNNPLEKRHNFAIFVFVTNMVDVCFVWFIDPYLSVRHIFCRIG